MFTPQPQLQGPLAHCLLRLHLDSVPFHIYSSDDADPSLGSHLHHSRNQDQLQKTKFLNCSHPSAKDSVRSLYSVPLESQVQIVWNPPVPGVHFLLHLPCLSSLASACHLPLWAIPHCDFGMFFPLACLSFDPRHPIQYPGQRGHSVECVPCGVQLGYFGVTSAPRPLKYKNRGIKNTRVKYAKDA